MSDAHHPPHPALRLVWPGREQAISSASAPPEAFPRFVCSEPPGQAEPGNAVYLGDNLDTLKYLAETQRGQVQIIYIDPPYNTGREFGYHDHFRRSADRAAGGADDSAARHAGWLNFMYPRLALARELLADDGVLVVSIDDLEQPYLRAILDEIFGEENFVNTVIWYYAAMSKQSPRKLRSAAEYLLVYAKDRRQVRINPVREEKLKFRNLFDAARRLSARFGFDLDEGLEAFGLYREAESGELFQWYNRSAGKKDYLREVVDSVWYVPVVNRMAREYVRGFGGQKPKELIKRILRVFGKPDSLVLDFFAGTGTTAEAVWELNAEDGGSRRFLLAQLPEPVNNERLREQGFALVSEITLWRLRRAAGDLTALSNRPADLSYRIYRNQPIS